MKSSKKKVTNQKKSVRKVALKAPRVVARKVLSSDADIELKQSSHSEISVSQPLIEFKPYGLAMGPLETRPVFLLKSLVGDLILPIWLNQKEAVDSLGGAQGTLQSPHIITEHLFKKLKCQLSSVNFIELEGATQWVELKGYSGSEAFVIRERATTALALCLHFKVPFYASEEFVQSCRNIEANLFQEYAQIDAQKLEKKRHHGYLM